MENDKKMESTATMDDRWDDCILDVLEHKMAVRDACLRHNVPKGSFYHHLQKRGMYEPKKKVSKLGGIAPKAQAKPKALVNKKAGNKDRAATEGRFHKIADEVWNDVFAQAEQGVLPLNQICRNAKVSTNAFYKERRRRQIARPGKIAVARPQAKPIAANAHELERLRSQVQLLTGENRAYKAMLRQTSKKRR